MTDWKNMLTINDKEEISRIKKLIFESKDMDDSMKKTLFTLYMLEWKKTKLQE